MKRKKKTTRSRVRNLITDKKVDRWLREARVGPCFYGSESPVIRHTGVDYICSVTGKARPVCVMHGHPGEGCCSWIGWMKPEDTHKASKRMPSNRCQEPMCVDGKPSYRCSRRKWNVCWQHAHNFEAGCCKVLPVDHGSSFKEYPLSKTYVDNGWDGESRSNAFKCEVKGCPSPTSPWFCKKRDRWVCDACRHDKKCCTDYSEEERWLRDENGKETEKEKPLKEVKFATID